MYAINDYSFGKLKISNILYIQDLILLGEKIIFDWHRRSGTLEDIRKIDDYQPDTIFIGTGKFGLMKVSETLKNTLKLHEIVNLVIKKSGSIIQKFPDYSLAKKALAIHLSC
ncbi:MAG: Mth938-like domain-containing protein [Candidatus Marinimicrobia bacterium]|nr:Mth938-like domain-containing protein [Candidatus Neomarinimicrobiota bacterium]